MKYKGYTPRDHRDALAEHLGTLNSIWCWGAGLELGITILARIWKICKNIVLAKARAGSAVIDEVAHGIP